MGKTWPKLLSVKSCFIHKFRIISQKVNIGSTFVRHLEDYRWEGKIGGEGHWCNWAIKTYLPQMGLHWFSWKCQQTKTFAISDGFASLNLNWFHQTSGMFSGVGFWLRCQVHPDNDISTWIKLSFPFLTNRLSQAIELPRVISRCKLNLRRSCQEQQLI